jgi:hypothetical protein
VGLGALVGHGGVLDLAAKLAVEQPLGRSFAIVALGLVCLVLLVLPAVFGDGEGGGPRRVLAWRPLAWIGLVSYGMYLWQLTVAELLGLRSDPAHFSAPGPGPRRPRAQPRDAGPVRPHLRLHRGHRRRRLLPGRAAVPAAQKR